MTAKLFYIESDSLISDKTYISTVYRGLELVR